MLEGDRAMSRGLNWQQTVLLADTIEYDSQ